MTTSEFYINGQLLDIDQSTIIALSFAVNALNDLKTLNGNVSNKVVLPRTEKNLKIMGYVGDVNVDLTNTMRKRLTCKYVQNGTEVIPEGVVTVGTINKKGIAIDFTSGNVDFFDAIDGSLQELDFSEYDHIYGNVPAVDSRLNREGYIYPIINYGDLTDASEFMDILTMRPAMFVKTVLSKIVSESGFTLINELATHPRTVDQYNNMILPFSLDNFVHGDRFTKVAESYKLIAKQEDVLPRTYNLTSYTIDTNYSLVQYDHTILDVSTALVDHGIYEAPGKFIADIQVTIPSVKFPQFVGGGSNRTRVLQLVKRNEFGMVTVLQDMTLVAPDVMTSYDYTNLVFKVQGVKIKYSGIGEEYYLRFGSKVVGGELDMIVDRPVTFTVTPVKANVSPGENVELEATLPEMSKKDFIKGIAAMFSGIVQTDNQNKTVHIVPFVRIVNGTPEAVNWSGRVVDPDAENTDIRIGKYAQTNVAVYDNDDTIEPSDYAAGSIKIADENLPLSGELFKVPFSASQDVFVLSGLRAVLIKKIAEENGTDMSGSTNPRVALLDFTDREVSFRTGEDPGFTNIVDNSIPQTYFAGDTDQPGLTLVELLARHYPEVNVILNDQLKKSLKLMLNEVDIANLDFFKPIYLSHYATYFYISKITDYTGTKACTTELIKLF